MDDRLRVLDLVDVPEQWRDIEERIPRPTLPARPSTARRVATSVMALAVAAAGTTVAVVALRDGSPPSAGGYAGSYTDPTYAWTIEFSDGLRLMPIAAEGGRQAVSGAVISNFAIEHAETLSELRDLPADGVALRIWHNEGLLFPISTNDVSFPLSMQDLHPIARYVGSAEPRPLYKSFYANGTPLMSPSGSARTHRRRCARRSAGRVTQRSSSMTTVRRTNRLCGPWGSSRKTRQDFSIL
jgi:hypothetical protein